MKNFEIKTIEHDGIKVAVQINYDKAEVTLVERQGEYNEFPYKAKQFLFKNRGLEYMDAWVKILEAMSIAVKECKSLLEKDLAEKNARREQEVVRMVGLIEEATEKFHRPASIKIEEIEFKPVKNKRKYSKNK